MGAAIGLEGEGCCYGGVVGTVVVDGGGRMSRVSWGLYLKRGWGSWPLKQSNR